MADKNTLMRMINYLVPLKLPTNDTTSSLEDEVVKTTSKDGETQGNNRYNPRSRKARNYVPVGNRIKFFILSSYVSLA